MSDERTTLEIIAPTVDEAISKGLADLGLPLEAVEVEVLDSGSRGLFGLGSRHARIRLTLKGAQDVPAPVRTQKVVETGPTAQREQPARPARPARSTPAAVELEPEEVQPAFERVAGEDAGEDEHSLRVARETVSELLDKMRVRASVTARFLAVEDARSQPAILVEIHGDDLSILIGRRSETLNALQYISSLIVGKELERWTPLVIDVEGYRARRERQLRQLARKMADQTMATTKRQVLEPMPANERRIIHLELRDHPDVITESIGDEPNRKVTVSLKK